MKGSATWRGAGRARSLNVESAFATLSSADGVHEPSRPGPPIEGSGAIWTEAAVSIMLRSITAGLADKKFMVNIVFILFV